jgi:hypothetical protein
MSEPTEDADLHALIPDFRVTHEQLWAPDRAWPWRLRKHAAADRSASDLLDLVLEAGERADAHVFEGRVDGQRDDDGVGPEPLREAMRSDHVGSG